MALLSSLIWVAIGVVYVVYKCFQESSQEDRSAASIGVAIVALLGVCLLIGSISSKLAGEAEGFARFLLICSTFAPLVLFVIVFIRAINKQDEEVKRRNTPEFIEKSRNSRKQEISADFARYGYHIADEVLDDLIADPISPINYGNCKEVSLYKCYIWMCKKYTFKMNEVKGDELSKELGVPLESIPLNEDLPKGQAYLCRSLLAKNYILMKKGLKYYEFSDTLQYRYSSLYLNEKKRIL